MAEHRELHTCFRPSRDYIVCAVPLIALAVAIYGWRPLIIVVIAVITALVCDLLNALLRRQRFDISDISSINFVIVFVLMLPASVSYSVVVFGAAATVLLGKHAFGGYGCYPFHPTAFGFALTSVCWPQQVFNYPEPFTQLGLGINCTALLYEAPAYTLKMGGVPDYDLTDLLIGNFPGPMGATFCLIIIAAFVLLAEHRTMTMHTSVAFFLTCSLYAFVFPRIPATRPESVLYEMLSGALVFGAVFIANEPSCSPKRPTAKLVYGAILGLTTMLVRQFGVYEMGFCYAILLVNPLAGYLDRKFSSPGKRLTQRTEAQTDAE